jgi:hypothetical protein
MPVEAYALPRPYRRLALEPDDPSREKPERIALNRMDRDHVRLDDSMDD